MPELLQSLSENGGTHIGSLIDRGGLSNQPSEKPRVKLLLHRVLPESSAWFPERLRSRHHKFPSHGSWLPSGCSRLQFVPVRPSTDHSSARTSEVVLRDGRAQHAPETPSPGILSTCPPLKARPNECLSHRGCTASGLVRLQN